MSQAAVGVNISFDRIVHAALEEKNLQAYTGYMIDVCSLSGRALLKEKLALLKELWSKGLRAQLLQHTTEVRGFVPSCCSIPLR